MSKFYTKLGDNGFTYVKGNPKTPKNDIIVHLLGEIDELNSNIGYLAAILPKEQMAQEIAEFMDEIMSALFSVGSYLGYDSPLDNDLLENFVKFLEDKIDLYENFNGPLKSFILPSGSPCSAYAQVCRTVCRRVERNLYDVEKAQENQTVLKFFNRLSDFLFSVARTCNRLTGGKEINWQKII